MPNLYDDKSIFSFSSSPSSVSVKEFIDSCEDDKLVFIGEYIDTKYEVTLFAKDHVKGKFKIHNFNEIEV